MFLHAHTSIWSFRHEHKYAHMDVYMCTQIQTFALKDTFYT